MIFQPWPQLVELVQIALATRSARTTINDSRCQMLSKRGGNKKRELFPALQGLFS